MSDKTPSSTVRASTGATGVPRWLGDNAAAVLLSGQTRAGRNRHDRQLTSPVLLHRGRADALLSAATPLRSDAAIPSGMLGRPDWDVARRGKEIIRAVESFGGASSTLVVQQPGEDLLEIDHIRDKISLAHPRFRVTAEGRDADVLTAMDRRRGTMWRVATGASAPPAPLGEGLLPQLVDTGKGEYLLSLTPLRGDRSPLGDTAGQLTVSAIGKTGLANGFQPVAGVETLKVYDFDVAVRDTGEILVLAATRQGLHLFTGSPEALTNVATVTASAILHPALALIGTTCHVAYNTVQAGTIGQTETTTLDL